jgi:hypothetical protein
MPGYASVVKYSILQDQDKQAWYTSNRMRRPHTDRPSPRLFFRCFQPFLVIIGVTTLSYLLRNDDRVPQTPTHWAEFEGRPTAERRAR